MQIPSMTDLRVIKGVSGEAAIAKGASKSSRPDSLPNRKSSYELSAPQKDQINLEEDSGTEYWRLKFKKGHITSDSSSGVTNSSISLVNVSHRDNSDRGCDTQDTLSEHDSSHQHRGTASYRAAHIHRC